MDSFEQLKQEIMSDSDNKKYTDEGIEPLFSTPSTARILIVGQAPGIKAQESKIFFNDKSGVKLREWMGINEKQQNLTETVFNYKQYLPRYFPIVHPSPLNFRWHNKNPWFIEEVVPELQKRVKEILQK